MRELFYELFTIENIYMHRRYMDIRMDKATKQPIYEFENFRFSDATPINKMDNKQLAIAIKNEEKYNGNAKDQYNHYEEKTNDWSSALYSFNFLRHTQHKKNKAFLFFHLHPMYMLLKREEAMRMSIFERNMRNREGTKKL